MRLDHLLSMEKMRIGISADSKVGRVRKDMKEKSTGRYERYPRDTKGWKETKLFFLSPVPILRFADRTLKTIYNNCEERRREKESSKRISKNV